MRKVGIVGGGQLGRMLIQAGIDLDLWLRVLDSAPDSPCSGIAHDFVVGSVREANMIEQFAEGLDLVTIELEDVSTEGLLRAHRKGVAVYPHPDVVALFQDKGTQRKWYAENGFPSPRFQLWAPGERVNLSFPLVQKAFRGGYDGRGVQVAKAESDLWTIPSLLEEKVEIHKEISVIAARSRRGEVRTFPPVESVFHPEAHIVEYLRLPADLPRPILQEAEYIAASIVEQLQMVGLLAVEFFYTTDGRWLVNEAAPRPHNTGHITTKACWTSQFEQHWRAILGLPLGETRFHTYGGLVNILGPAGLHGIPILPTLSAILGIQGVSVHLYGKKRTSPFRKLGHIIVLAESLQALLDKIQSVRQLLRVEVRAD
ncbi:MAG: 5-(carboxyamino)imidazole ribonucleotide synthase [Bacteroidia bacterium]|nr:5-(carboxyamino)imidazole ribonucleotide synthase [Bacteroidia bacterium]MCX7652000.1 5-(carboxyamino)imidazole ribonucleotide synthase [Bacteroidia bacterium]MDW8416329.1 5-(carboxyamino)imidazole ribonucleotide synthase [Bacteroidia bacterium]